MGGSSGGQQPVTQQTLQTKDPWAPAQPYLQQIMGGAIGNLNLDQGYQPFTGNTVAPLQNQYMTPGMANIAAIANAEPAGSANVTAARGFLGDMVGNQGLSDPLKTMAAGLADTSNPYIQSMGQQRMNQANAAAAGAGRYGSGMHDAAVAQAIAPTLLQGQGLAADIYNQGLQRAGNAAQLIPTLDEARYAGAG